MATSSDIEPFLLWQSVTVTGSRTLALTDNHKKLKCTNSSAIIITVPNHYSVTFPVGSPLTIQQYGTGGVTIAASPGVTIRSKEDKMKLGGQYSGVTLVKEATNEWWLAGDLV